LQAESTNEAAEAVEPSAMCHESQLKNLNVPSKEKAVVSILKNMHIEKPLNLADLPTGDPGKIFFFIPR
jgi:hypothetical protein